MWSHVNCEGYDGLTFSILRENYSIDIEIHVLKEKWHGGYSIHDPYKK